MKTKDYYCRHQQQQEENTKRWIEDYFAAAQQQKTIEQTARDAAQDFIDSQKQKIEIEVDKRSLAEIETQLRKLF